MEQQKHPSTPTLKRPQNRRCYFHKKSPYTQRAVKLSLEDVDKIFDLYDDDDEEDIIPPSPVEETQARAAQVPKGKVLQSATTSNRPVLDIELNSPFKNLAMFKTSSPIEQDENSSPIERDEQDDMGRLSPIPFCIDEEEEPERMLQKTTDVMHTFEVESPSERITFKKSLAPSKKVAAPQMAAPQQGNGCLPAVSLRRLVTPKIHTFEVESPPERITLKKTPAPLKKVAAPQQGNGHVPVVSAVTREPHNTVQEKKSNGLKETPAPSKKVAAPQQGNGRVPVVSAVTREPHNTVQEKKSNGLKETPAPSKKLVTPQINTFEVESPPERITLKKTLAPLKKVVAPHKETGPGASKTLKESEMPAEVRREKPKQGNGDKLVSALSQEPQRTAQENTSKIPTLSKKVAAPQQGNGHPPVMVVRQEKPPNTAQEKKSNELKETPGPSKNLAALHKETGPRQKPQNTAQEPPVEKSSHEETNFDAFLLKLKEAGRSKPTPPMKICLPIRAPTPPPEEDEFRILEEDDFPLLYNLSRKNKGRPRMKQGTTSDAEVKGSADKFSKETQPEEAEKRQVSSEAGSTEDNQTGKIPSKERTAADKAEEEPKDRTTNGKESMEMKKRGPKSRDGKEKAAKTRAKSTKKTREWIEEPEDAMELQSQKPPRKGHGGQTRVKSTKENREWIEEPEDAVELQSQEPPGKEHGGVHQEEDVTSAEKIRNPGGGPKRTSKDLADGKTKKLKIPSPVENASSPDRFVAGKRKRKPPGDWWLSHGLDTLLEAVESPDVDTVKISQHGEVETQKKQSEPGQKAYKKKATLTKVRKEKKQQHHTPEKTMSALSEKVQNQEELPQQADFDPVPSSSLVFPLGEASIMTGDRLFDRINHHTPNAKVHNKQASNTPKTIPEHVASLLPEKRKRKSVVGEVPENDVEIPAIKLQKPNSKSPKTRKKARMQRMTAFEDSFSTTRTPYTDSSRNKHQIEGKILFPVQEEQASLTSDARECPTVEVVATDITETSAECWPSKNDRFQNGKRRFSDKVQGLTSGPSSMIALEAYEEQDIVSVLPSPGIHSALSATQLCVFPLAPVALQASDEENLRKWFRILWPATVKTAGHMDPDVFRWFSYRGRIMGVCEDILHNDWCVGKMLLGSHGQKPLWVDHSATTVYNVLTSAVSVKTDGTVSQYNPGLSFTVPCGHAHGIKNLTDEPAVLYFTRMRSQNAD